jgi:hypothetical protein
MSTNKPPTKIEWEEPEPIAPRKGSRWDPVAAALKARPGQWACIGRNIQTSIVYDINKGVLKCWRPAGAFEAVSRNHSQRWQADVYVRYVGEE